MSDEITKMMEKQRKELVAAGEIKEDEKLSFTELLRRYTAYQMKKSREEMKGLGLIASDKPGEKPAAQKKASPEEKPAKPKRRDSIEAKLQGQHHDALNKLLAPWEKERERVKQNEGIVVEFLKVQKPLLAEEYTKLQAWLAQPIDDAKDEKVIMAEARKRVENINKLFEKHLAPTENLQKRVDLLRAELHNKNAGVERLHLEMAERAKELESFFKNNAEGVNE